MSKINAFIRYAITFVIAIGNVSCNAIKYSPAGSLIDISAAETDKSVVISVTDEGIGIPASDLENIWERLFRGETASQHHGLGLGLSLVKSIVEAHKGTDEERISWFCSSS